MENKQCPVPPAFTQQGDIHPQVLVFNESHCEWQCWAEAKPASDGAVWAAQLFCAPAVLLGLAFYNLAAQEVKMRDSADFSIFFSSNIPLMLVFLGQGFLVS